MERALVTRWAVGGSIVGVLFILNGEIQTLEVFDTPSLFKKAHRPILESFLAEASAWAEKESKPLDKAAYTGFIAECLSAPVPKSEGYNRWMARVTRVAALIQKPARRLLTVLSRRNRSKCRRFHPKIS